MDRKEKASLCLLHSIKGIGSRTLFKIKQEFGGFAACMEADIKKLRASSLSPLIAEAVYDLRKRESALDYLEKLAKSKIGVISNADVDYPKALKNIYDPPAILYYRGNIQVLQGFDIAVVGARVATVYGKNTARLLAGELTRQNVTVISGMARGIDTEAHWGALEQNGKTAAVLGCGIDVIYPRENSKLYQQIWEKGVIISEFAPGTAPEPGNFPMRNRIISGLSRGVLVVEAGQKSGALITADFALEQGRDVFAVPGPVNSRLSIGTNRLIKQGAIMVTCVKDITNEYYDFPAIPENYIKQEELPLLDNREKLVVDNLELEPCHFDKISAKTHIDIGELSTILMNLEIKGIVKSMPGNYYVII